MLPPHRATELGKFLDEIEANVPGDLDVNLVIDNYAMHKTAPRSEDTYPLPRVRGALTHDEPVGQGSPVHYFPLKVIKD